MSKKVSVINHGHDDGVGGVGGARGTCGGMARDKKEDAQLFPFRPYVAPTSRLRKAKYYYIIVVIARDVCMYVCIFIYIYMRITFNPADDKTLVRVSPRAPRSRYKLLALCVSSPFIIARSTQQQQQRQQHGNEEENYGIAIRRQK